MARAEVTLKVSLEEIDEIRRCLEECEDTAEEYQKSLEIGCEEWQLTGQRRMRIERIQRTLAS